MNAAAMTTAAQRTPFCFRVKSQLAVDGMCPAGYNETLLKLGLGTFKDPALLDTRYMNPKANPEVTWEWMLANTSFEVAIGSSRIFDLPVEEIFLKHCIAELRSLIEAKAPRGGPAGLTNDQETLLAGARRYEEDARRRAEAHPTPGYELYFQHARLGIVSMECADQSLYDDSALLFAQRWAERLSDWRAAVRELPPTGRPSRPAQDLR